MDDRPRPAAPGSAPRAPPSNPDEAKDGRGRGEESTVRGYGRSVCGLIAGALALTACHGGGGGGTAADAGAEAGAGAGDGAAADAGPDEAMDGGPRTDGGPETDAAPNLDGPAPARLLVGWDDVCVLTDRGALHCATQDREGAVGAFEPVNGLEGIVDVALWGAHLCAVDGDGAVWCWGSNTVGQLGDGTEEDRAQPTRVEGLTSLGRVAVSGNHSCATAMDPELRRPTVTCWGLDVDGQLGTCGDEYIRSTPWPGSQPCIGGWAVISALTDPATMEIGPLAAGGRSTCAAVRADDPFGDPFRRLYCYGDNEHGQLGSADPSDAEVPRPVEGLDEVRSLSLGEQHACASTPIGEVYCWGDNTGGQLGDPAIEESPTPHRVPGVTRAVEVSAGTYHTCARLEDGTVTCWGAGQLAAGGFELLRTPRPIAGIEDAVRLASASNRTCALTAEGRIWCWNLRSTRDAPEPMEVVGPAGLARRAAVDEPPLDPDPASLPLCARACQRIYRECRGQLRGLDEAACVQTCDDWESMGGDPAVWSCAIAAAECQDLARCF